MWGSCKSTTLSLLKSFLTGTKFHLSPRNPLSRMASDIPQIKDLTTTVKLNDGHLMPCYGIGVYLAESGPGSEAEKATVYALKNGYKMVDTAQFYKNEEDVGRAIKQSGIPRQDIYVVTKLWNHGYDVCKRSFRESLKKLDLDYVDLFLIHNPAGGKNIESYNAMIELQKEGLIRSIGVSNFSAVHLEALRKAGKPTPAVNQFELHPYLRQQEIVDYCRQHGIAIMGFTPLTRGKKLDDPPLVKIAQKYNKTTAEILLRWSIQKGYITIPKSVTPARILANANVFDFTVADEDIRTMDTFPQERCTLATTEHPWLG